MSISSSMFLTTLFSIVTMIIQRRHLLSALLALEAVMLTITLIIVIFSSTNELFMSFVLLTVAACEASLGLACLVIITRSFGNDLFKTFSSNKC
uniref:NADH-ubiquinone oxidoreductase chain 4L n=1 Tax=Glycera dibranchiata TaxID=6350 RepID=A0A0S3CQS0_GLYDI|nr:NADH dehydrogenase subunit 4L [Glycera dibranchiata]